MQKICIILNPAARGERAKHLFDRIRALPGEPEVRVTLEPGDGQRLAQDACAEGFDVVVAAGGDGTINEVINGMAGRGPALGVLPVGSVNVFALELGLPTHLAKAWDVIRAGTPRQIDLARANNERFIQLAGVGLDAQIVSETDWGMKRSLGPLSYLITGVFVAARKPPRLQVRTAEGRELEGSFVLAGNGRFYGGPFEIFCGGRMDDGLLDVYVFERMSHFDIIRYLHGVLFRQHNRYPDVHALRTRSVHVDSDDLVPVEVDGELAGTVPVTFEIEPGALTVLTP